MQPFRLVIYIVKNVTVYPTVGRLYVFSNGKISQDFFLYHEAVRNSDWMMVIYKVERM
jgi:hypothetical protein